MSNSRLNRRHFLKGAAAAAAPYVIPAAALGHADTPPASERVTLGHIGVGNQGGGLFYSFQQCKGAQSVAIADAYKDRREAYARHDQGQGLRRLPRAAGPRRHRRRGRRHARPLARADRHRRRPGEEGRLRGEAAGREHRAGPRLPQGVSRRTSRIFQYGTQQRSSPHCRFGCELVRSGRIGKVHTIEVIAPNGGAGGSTEVVPVPPNLDYDMWCGPAPVKPYTADRCHPPGTYWIYDYSIGYLGGWGAHPLDIMVWGSDADLAGPMTVEGTGEIPAKGLYDTVYNWDMKIQLGDGVKMTFKPGGDSTKFIGSDGWVRDLARRHRRRAEVAAELEDRPERRAPDRQPATTARTSSTAVKSRKPAVSPLDHAVRSDTISQLCDIAVRTEAEDHLGPEEACKIVGDPQ